MPFGICSAPEVFQRRMHQVIEGPLGVEVIADDFVTVGLGETIEEATPLGSVLAAVPRKRFETEPR